MELFATVVYVISDEVTRILCLKEDHQSQMSDSEVITFAILAAKFFQEITKSQDTSASNLKCFHIF
jgi:hypothetical protein